MTQRRVAIRAAARRDLAEHYQWLAAEAGVEVAERLLDSADLGFARLAEQPHVGPNAGSRLEALKAVRKWKMPGFPRIIIFYEPRSDGVSIVRVLHAAQDWWEIFEAN